MVIRYYNKIVADDFEICEISYERNADAQEIAKLSEMAALSSNFGFLPKNICCAFSQYVKPGVEVTMCKKDFLEDVSYGKKIYAVFAGEKRKQMIALCTEKRVAFLQIKKGETFCGYDYANSLFGQ